MFTLSDSKMKKKRRAGSKARELMLEQEFHAQNNVRQDLHSDGAKKVQSHYAFNKPTIPPVSVELNLFI